MQDRRIRPKRTLSWRSLRIALSTSRHLTGDQRTLLRLRKSAQPVPNRIGSSVVTNTTTGAGSLRDAILFANAIRTRRSRSTFDERSGHASNIY